MRDSNEIIYKGQRLQYALSALKELKFGSKYRGKSREHFLTSISETSDEVEALFIVLQEVEDELVKIVNKTIQAMEEADVAFNKADAEAGREFRDLPYVIK